MRTGSLRMFGMLTVGNECGIKFRRANQRDEYQVRSQHPGARQWGKEESAPDQKGPLLESSMKLIWMRSEEVNYSLRSQDGRNLNLLH